MLLMYCVSHAFASVHCCLVVTCLVHVGDVYHIFVTFPCSIRDQVWYLFVSIPDLCHLSYFNIFHLDKKNSQISTDTFIDTSVFLRMS